MKIKIFFVSIMLSSILYGEISMNDIEDMKYCIFNVMGIDRRLLRPFCTNVRTFGSKIKVKHRADPYILTLGGKPGAGKSSLAREFARKTNSHYIVVSASGIMQSGYIGGGAAAINQAFDDALLHIARHKTSVVLIFEEIDSIAKPESNASNGESIRTCREFHERADQNQNNAQLMVICTTNNYMDCVEAFRSRCTYIPIDQPTDAEKKEILKRLLIDDTIDFIHQKYAAVCKNYREPLDILRDTVVILLERLRSSKKNCFQEFDLERAKLDIFRCRKALVDVALGQAKKDYLNIINELEEFVVACERNEPEHAKLTIFAQLSIDIDRLGDRYTSEVDQVAIKLFDLVSQIAKIDKIDQNTQEISALESGILQSKKFLSTLQNSELKEACYEFLNDLGVFIKVYGLIFDPDRMNLLTQDLDIGSIRSVKRLASEIRDIAHTNKLDEKAIELAKFLQKIDEPAERSAFRSKALDLLDRVGVSMASNIGTYLALGIPAYVLKQGLGQKANANTLNQKGENVDGCDASMVNQEFSQTILNLLNDEVFMTAYIEEFGELEAPSSDTFSSKTAKFVNNTLIPCVQIADNAYELYWELIDFYKVIRGTKDQLSPIDRYFFNVYSQHEKFLNLIESIGLEDIKQQYHEAVKQRLKNSIDTMNRRKQVSIDEERSSKERCETLIQKAQTIEQETNDLKRELAEKD